MLAQNFLPAYDLNLSESQRDGLISILGMLERGEILDKDFDMSITDLCILGHARKHFPDAFPYMPSLLAVFMMSENLRKLFSFHYKGEPLPASMQANVTQAASALRNFLTTGDAQWHEVMEKTINEKHFHTSLQYIYPDCRPDPHDINFGSILRNSFTYDISVPV